MSNTFYVEFNIDQFQLAQLMLQSGAVGIFDRMERYKNRKDLTFNLHNTSIAFDNPEDYLTLHRMLGIAKINHTVHFNFK